MREWDLLNRIKDAYQRILADHLTGIYVHGSIAFDCFRWECSDIDFLVVVEEPLTQTEKEALIRVLLELDSEAPPKGFEMSVMLRSACAPFADPAPFELHYSNAHRANYQRDLPGTCQNLHGLDPDLTAHIAVVRAVGIALCGEPVKAVFAPVPGESYLRSIWYDIQSAAEEIGHDPVYFTLNLCRALAAAEEGLVLSKARGALWAANRFPEDAALIHSALAAYQTGTPFSGGERLCSFAEKMLLLFRQNADFLNACIKND